MFRQIFVGSVHTNSWKMDFGHSKSIIGNT
jgi:hypothetical protein